MTERRRVALQLLGAVAGATVLVAAIDRLTNSIDATRFAWDLRYYIDMARRGLTPPLASPFAYRFLTPLLVRCIAATLHVPVESAFGSLARVAAVMQLTGVFLLAKWYSRSITGAWVAMLTTAFSLYHVKFLLFDPFRPDHLAYPLIVLQVYLGLRRKFWMLLVTTLIACQIREFNAAPLAAWVFVSLWETRRSTRADVRKMAIWHSLIALAGLTFALLVPRLLIPVAEDFQFASPTRDGLLRAVLAPLILARDANYIYSLLAYALPIMMLLPRGSLRAAWNAAPAWDRGFLGAYCVMVLVLGFLGGTDFGRFSTFLLPVLVLVLAHLIDRSPAFQVLVMLAGVFVFNRIWMPIPDANVDRYLDFYGAYGSRFNVASMLRAGELGVFVAVGVLFRGLSHPRNRSPSTSSA